MYPGELCRETESNLRHDETFGRAQRARGCLRREAGRGNGELERARGNGGDRELAIVTGEGLLAGGWVAGLILTGEFHLGADDRRSFWIDNRTRDVGPGLLVRLLSPDQGRKCAEQKEQTKPNKRQRTEDRRE